MRNGLQCAWGHSEEDLFETRLVLGPNYQSVRWINISFSFFDMWYFSLNIQGVTLVVIFPKQIWFAFWKLPNGVPINRNWKSSEFQQNFIHHTSAPKLKTTPTPPAKKMLGLLWPELFFFLADERSPSQMRREEVASTPKACALAAPTLCSSCPQ